MIQVAQSAPPVQPVQPVHRVGLDLHSNNVVAVMINKSERWVLKRKFTLNLPDILSALEPYKETILEIGVEATYNWYSVVDGFQEAGYKIRLAHPAKIEGNRSKKRTDDYDDAFHLAHLLRVNNFPDAYIYPKEDRPLRDLLRKRAFLVRSRTQYMVSFINLVNRNLGIAIGGNKVKKLSEEDVEELLEQEYLILSGQANISVMHHVEKEIHKLERVILRAGRLKAEFRKLLTIPGIGTIIALTIAYEAGDFSRFKKVGNYVSYCRCVDSKSLTNGKKKGENNRKSGNKYLCWAYVEAANFTKRYCPYAYVYYRHKLKESGLTVLALKALASKIARASYHVLTTDEPYNPEKVFERYKNEAQALISQKQKKGCGSKPGNGTGSKPGV
jgi:transposase